jgi:hypothetical protein
MVGFEILSCEKNLPSLIFYVKKYIQIYKWNSLKCSAIQVLKVTFSTAGVTNSYTDCKIMLNLHAQYVLLVVQLTCVKQDLRDIELNGYACVTKMKIWAQELKSCNSKLSEVTAVGSLVKLFGRQNKLGN